MLRNNRGQVFAIIEILVVVAIIVIFAAWLMPRYLTGGGSSKTPGAPATPKERAQGVDCMNNLRQIRYAIDMYKQSSEEGKAPLALSELREIPEEMTKCDVSGQPFTYDPSTGTVRCTTPGHGSY